MRLDFGTYESSEFCFGAGDEQALQFINKGPNLICAMEVSNMPRQLAVKKGYRVCEVLAEATAFGAAFVYPFRLTFLYEPHNFNIVPPPLRTHRKRLDEVLRAKGEDGDDTPPYSPFDEFEVKKLVWVLPVFDINHPNMHHPYYDRMLTEMEWKKIEATKEGILDWITQQAIRFLRNDWGDKDFSSRYSRKRQAWEPLRSYVPGDSFKQFVMTELTPF